MVSIERPERTTPLQYSKAPNEKAAMKMAIRRAEAMTLETMVAAPVEEARKLVE